ncbi:MAG: glycosyltransferase family 2 protein [Cellulosilyticaceae bacterium]
MISIIVPIYNAGNYIEECLDSFMAQTFKEFEVILVNDGSTDDSKDVCERYKKGRPQIKLINQVNRGVGEARNTGLEHATGEYIYFCDPDDWIEPTLLEDNVKLMEEHHADMIVFGVWREWRKNNRVLDKTSIEYAFEVHSNDEHIKERLYDWCFNSSGLVDSVCNKIYRMDFLRGMEARFNTLRVGEDSIFNLEVFKHIRSIVINNKQYYHYVSRMAKISATTQYTPEYFDILKKVNQYYRALFKHWNVECSREIDIQYLIRLEGCIERICKKKYHLRYSERCQKVMEILQDEDVKRIVGSLSTQKGLNWKLIGKFFRAKYVSILVIFYSIDRFFKETWYGLVGKLESFN